MSVIGLAARGDPYSRSTWSGTPRALTEALTSQGISVDARSLAWAKGGRLETPWRYSMGLLNAPRFGLRARHSTDFLWASTAINRRKMVQWRASRPDLPILHTDTPWLPYEGFGSADYLYLDAPWSFHKLLFHVPDAIARRQESQIQEIYARAAGIFTTSHWARERLIIDHAVDPQRVHVAGTGCAFIPEPQQKDYGNGVTLFVAKQRFAEKGGALLLEAFAIARLHDPRLRLILVVAKKQHIPELPGVEVKREVSFEELVRLYHHSALFAMPALMEPWGLVYLEALRAKTPLLGTDRFAFPEIVSNGQLGFIVKDTSPVAIADALYRAHADPSTLASMGSSGYCYVTSNFTWELTAARIWSLICSMQ